MVVVKDTDGAPLAAFAVADPPTPLAALNVTNVSDCRYPTTLGVEVTVAFVRMLVAVAFQISEVPLWALARFTSVQVRPAPETVIDCRRVGGPSDATNASRSSLAFAVLKVGVKRVPGPSEETICP